MTDGIMPTEVIDQSRLHVGARQPRPMLARVADATYWMARYVERAEHVARSLLVNTDLLTDVGDMTPELRQQLWEVVLQITDRTAEEAGVEPETPGKEADDVIPPFMAFDQENANSLVSCLTKARENARSIRENISGEMWETLNTMYWKIRSDETTQKFAESPPEVYRMVLDSSMLFQGLTDQTMQHGQPWHFAQVGKYLERIDMTCRILDAKYNILRAAEDQLEAPLRNIHWMAVLRSCGSIEAYRRMYLGDMDPMKVATFIVFEPSFPRAIRYAVRHAQMSAAKIKELANPDLLDGADRILGRLSADLEYADTETIMRTGLPQFLHQIRNSIALAGQATQKAYFLS